MRESFLLRRLWLLLVVACAAACAHTVPAPPPETPPAAVATSAPRPVPTPTPPALPPPADNAPSGVLFRVGLKSDLTEFVYGPPGQRWIVVTGGGAELLRGTLHFGPEGAAAETFLVQAGAFSQEETARSILERLSSQFQTDGAVAFAAERGVFRVLLGSFSERASAQGLADRIRAGGQDAFVVEGGTRQAVATMALTGEDGLSRRLSSPADLYPSNGDSRALLDGKPYRGSLRVLVNPRGTINVVNRVDLEEYLYGVVPSEMGPKRYDELEALKAQAIAARTYAYAHRGQFEAEGYDICATAKCQVYSGLSAEDPLSNSAVDTTRGLVLAYQGRFADALFVSTCGGRTEDVENVFAGAAEPYLVSVECGELSTTSVPGARVETGAARRERTGLEWRGYVLRRHAPRKKAVRLAALEIAQQWAGVSKKAAAPTSLTPSAVYPSVLNAFELGEARVLHLLSRDETYYSDPPAASGRLRGSTREAYDFLMRFRFGAGEALPAPERMLNEEEYAGLLFSVALRLSGVTEGSGRFLRREGSNLWVKGSDGRLGLPVDPDVPLARRVGDSFFLTPQLTLRAGDRLGWWKRGTDLLALWVELDPAGPSFERDSAWTEWIRRVSGTELQHRMAGRIAGTEVRSITVTKRSSSGRAIEIVVRTDSAEATLRRFDLRQALGLPELLFSVERVRGADGEVEFVFLGRGWGHGVGLCQNGAYGMALAGETADAILKHYYTGIDIVQASTVAAVATPSTR